MKYPARKICMGIQFSVQNQNAVKLTSEVNSDCLFALQSIIFSRNARGIERRDYKYKLGVQRDTPSFLAGGHARGGHGRCDGLPPYFMTLIQWSFSPEGPPRLSQASFYRPEKEAALPPSKHKTFV